MNKYFLMFGILLVLPLIFAQTYQIEKEAYLKIPFTVNGSVASSSAVCNVSIDYPNGNYLRENASMTNRGSGDFNITLSDSEINQLGEYEWRAFCCDSSNCAAGYGSFKVTATGNVLSTAQSIVYVIFLTAIIFVFCLSLYGAIRIPFRNQRAEDGKVINVNDLKYLKIISIVISYLLLMFIFGVTRSILANYLYLSGASAVFTWLFWLMFGFLWPIMVVSLLLAVVYYLQDLKIKESISRGVPIR